MRRSRATARRSRSRGRCRTSRGSPNLHHGLASGYSRIGETRQALDYFERAVNLARVHDEMHGTFAVNLARLENDYAERKQIMSDLRIAAQGKGVVDIIEREPVTATWLRDQGMSAQQLLGVAEPDPNE
jgi:hypothetical protein